MRAEDAGVDLAEVVPVLAAVALNVAHDCIGFGQTKLLGGGSGVLWDDFAFSPITVSHVVHGVSRWVDERVVL